MIKELENIFKRGERTFELIEKSKNWYIYKVTFHKGKELEHSCYELFKRKELKATGCCANTKKYAGYEKYVKYPGDEDFGKWAWTSPFLDRIYSIIQEENL